MENYLEINKDSWSKKLEHHLDSDFYDMPAFMAGKNSLNPIELELLGDVRGKKILHLQCHFGQDTISLSRMGAEVTGVDFSEQSIAKGKELAQELGTSTQFICADVYNLLELLKEQFDIVFTTYGTIIWMPDIKRWAEVVGRFLKPGGKFVFADFHPFVWMHNDELDEVIYPYSNSQAIVEHEEGTYADEQAPIKSSNVTWNHGIGEVVNALVSNGVNLLDLQEYNYSPYPFLSNMEEAEPGKHRTKRFGDKVPLVYSILGEKAE